MNSKTLATTDIVTDSFHKLPIEDLCRYALSHRIIVENESREGFLVGTLGQEYPHKRVCVIVNEDYEYWEIKNTTFSRVSR